MERIAVVSAVRTPIGSYLGALRDVPAYELVAEVLNEAVKRVGIKPEEVGDVIFGQCYQSGEYVNVARRGLLQAGWSVTVPGITIDRRCTSGLDALVFGALEILTGMSRIVVAGGVESMSTAEFYIPGNIKWGIGRGAGISFPDSPRGHGSLKIFGIPLYDRIQRARYMHIPAERFGEIISNVVWAENVARELGITREECDRWALRSHQKAVEAQRSGRFKDQIVPVAITRPDGSVKIVDTDEGPRSDTSMEALSRLKPEMGGVCTAGNSAQENDAAAALVLMGEGTARERGIEPFAYLKDWVKTADDPRYPPRALTAAFELLLKKTGLTVEQIDLFEIHEAFAAQCLYNIKTLGIPESLWDKINVNGSGISLGHPVGATSALRITSLVHEMKRRNAKYGMVGTPGTGGNAVAAIFERTV